MGERRTKTRTQNDAPARLGGHAEPSLSEAFARYYDLARQAQGTYNSREQMLFESDPERISRMVDLLIEGQYRETACRIVGISSRAVRLWVQAAEGGDPRCQPLVHLIHAAESLAEASAVRAVRAAGKDPRFWAAEMTYLERKHPDRWGRRSDDASVPKVIVQIGARDSDVSVNAVVVPQPATASE